MLIIPTAQEAEKYIDFAYELALDPTRSGYPTYTDGIKTKDDFIESFHWCVTHNDRQLLLYLEEGQVLGWIQFLFETDDRYLETSVFNIAGDIQAALKEFITYCQENFAGYRVCMGFPGDNQAAIHYLTESGWPCEEQSFNNVLFFDHYELLPEDANVVKVNRENFSDFRKLHAPIQGSMYWNCDRLYDALNSWDIYVYYENNEPVAAIYNRDAEILMHIYGVDYLDNIYRPHAFRILMTKVLNDCKRSGKKYMVFFGEQQDQQEALDLGYTCVGEYVLFATEV